MIIWHVLDFGLSFERACTVTSLHYKTQMFFKNNQDTYLLTFLVSYSMIFSSREQKDPFIWMSMRLWEKSYSLHVWKCKKRKNLCFPRRTIKYDFYNNQFINYYYIYFWMCKNIKNRETIFLQYDKLTMTYLKKMMTPTFSIFFC
jgi:hypothetical protein